MKRDSVGIPHVAGEAEMTSLADARKAIDRGEHGAALTVLLAVWRETPHDRLAAVIAEVSDVVDRTTEPIAGKTQDARLREALGRIGDAAQLPRVLRLFDDLQIAKAKLLVAALAEIEDRDPRILDATLRLLAKPPFAGSSALPFWRALIDLVAAQEDPRARVALSKREFGKNLTAWQRTQLEQVCARIEKPKRGAAKPKSATLDAKQLAACDAIEKALGGANADGDALLARIFGEPGDLAARTVYADWLEEQGDARGPFMTAQLACADRAPTETERRVIASALEANEKSWLGALADRVHKVRFERGFPTVAGVSHDDLPGLAGAREAATLEEIWLHGEDSPELDVLRPLRGLRLVGGLGSNAIELVLRGKPWPWTGIGFDLFDIAPGRGGAWTTEARELGARIADAREVLPNVRELAVEAYARDKVGFIPLWSGTLGNGLERLRIASGVASVPYWLANVDKIPGSVRELELSFDFGFHDWSCWLYRGERGGFSRVVATLRPGRRDFQKSSLGDIAAELLDEVATDLLTDVEVRADGVRIQGSTLDRIVAAATRHSRLRRLVLPGRDPIDATAKAGRAPVKTAKQVAADGRAKQLAEFDAAVRKVAGALADKLQPASWDDPPTLASTAAWLTSAGHVELAYVLLGAPAPSTWSSAWTRARDQVATAAFQLLVKHTKPPAFERLFPLVRCAGSPADVLFTMIDADRRIARALIDRASLSALLDWFETLTVRGVSGIYEGIRSTLIAVGDKSTRADLRARLAKHELHRFHRWTYEEAAKGIR